MRAIEIIKPGAPEVLTPCDRPIPAAKAGEVLIKVHAAGVNRPDVLQRTGNYPVPAGASDIPGLEVAGEIVDGDLAADRERAVAPRREERQVPVMEEPDYEAGAVNTYRTDTNVIVATRGMTPEERQRSLFDAGKKAKK